MGRWLGLGAYTALLYGLLPFGPAIGRAVQDTAAGKFVLGRGAGWIVALGAIAIVVRLRRRAAPASAWLLAAVVAVGYTLALGWLRAVRLERVHLPEYGIAAWLAWRALLPSLGERWPVYAAAWLLATAIGWGDELVQSVTPGRFYDVRDIGANALGAGLGVLALAVWRTGAPESATQHGHDRADERHHEH
jgi:VanZ like protein